MLQQFSQPQQHHQKDDRGRSKSKQPYDPSRNKSKSPGRNGSKPGSRSNTPDKGQKTRSPSPYDRNKPRSQSDERRYKEYREKNRNRNSTPTRQHQQTPQTETQAATGVTRGPMTSDAGKSALTLNIGDQNQYYQCATATCSKTHVWPKNTPLPSFCPEICAEQFSKN